MKNENSKNKCEEIELLIDESIDETITIDEKKKIDEHISECNACSEYLKKTAEIVKEINSIPTEAVYLSYQKKSEIWDKLEPEIDINRYKNGNNKIKEETSVDESKSGNFISNLKYIVTGIAAVLLIGFIVYGVKNMKVSNDRLSQQNPLGIANFWKVSNLQGESKIGNAAMGKIDSIQEGQYIQTDLNSRAELLIANIGKVIIEPNSKVLFIKGTDGNNRIQLEYGTINSDMISNGKTFFVEMPSAVASDNGGSYTITIDSVGDGIVFVKSGKVDVDSPNRDAIIPAGNVVFTKKDFGVGTPFNESASPKFKTALFNYDFGVCNDACVSVLINNAKMSDAVTLANLIPNVQKAYTDQVYAKLAGFVQPPGRERRDSLKFFNEEELNEWIDKIQVEVQVNVDRSMKEVQKSLENLHELKTISPETIKGLENLSKNWKFNIKTSPRGNYVWESDSMEFDKAQFEEDMKEMQKDIEENNRENQEQLKEDMDQLKEDLKEMEKDLKENYENNYNFNSEELKTELKKANEEIRKAMIEAQKFYKQDSAHNRVKVKVNDNNDPEIPEEDGK
jgi:hypothetical protein